LFHLVEPAFSIRHLAGNASCPWNFHQMTRNTKPHSPRSQTRQLLKHTQDIPSDGQAKFDAKKGNHCRDAPQDANGWSISIVIGIAKLMKIRPPSWKHFQAPQNSNRKQHNLHEHRRAD
jgi:hypothetical protein